MSFESPIRINELAKELGISSKEIVEKYTQMGITGKTHSSTVTPDQIRRLKEFISQGSQVVAKKPKAFVVKKAKNVEEPEEKAPEKTEEKPEKPAPRVEVVKPKPVVNRLEIVRRAPRAEEGERRPYPNKPMTENRRYPQRDASQNKFPPRTEKGDRGEKRPFDKKSSQTREEQRPNREQGDKKPIERRIIPQEIYDNKSNSRKRTEGGANKKKNKDFNSKKEEQEVTQAMTISELSEKIQRTPAEIVKFLMLNGIMATLNQLIDVEVIKKICNEFGIEVLEEDLDAYIEEELEKEQKSKALEEVDKKLLKKRAPVVSIMGHVDHGKTTLLDSIRASKHKIVATEVGGITQSIGAYTVYVGDKKVVFLDTPGHEAFTEMRARGAKATDIAILVVAADDGIMPQTIEAINHAKAAEIPIIVAVNKIDKPGANPDKILQQLTEHGLVPEEWGGDTITVKVSALQGTGIDELLEYILLVADMEELKANPKAEASGVVIEANLDKGKGPVATLLVQNGTLRVGNCIVVGTACGRVRALLSDSGERIQKAEPSTPVEILGLTEVPQAGEHFEVVQNEKEMKAIVDKRKERERNKRIEATLPAHIRREAVAGDNDIPQLNLIIKANTHGSAEAVSQAIAQLESNLIKTKIIHVGVGDISEADVMLASASGALILGFTVKEDSNTLIAAEKEGVVIKKYDIIYQILEDIEKTMLSLLEPETKEVQLGKAEIRQIFTIGKTTKIAGCYVTEGKIIRGKNAVLIRDGKEIFTGAIDQLKRFKDDVKEVAQGFECGISFAKFNDIQIGDIIQVSTTEEVERTSL